MTTQKPIRKLYIPNLEKDVSHEAIVEAFRQQDLAHIDVSKIIIKRSHGYCWRHSQQFLEASITLDYWHDSEAAYTFIQSLRTTKITKLMFDPADESKFWCVKENRPSSSKKHGGKQVKNVEKTEDNELEQYLHEANIARKTLAYEEDNWMFDQHIFEEYQREIYSLSQSLLVE